MNNNLHRKWMGMLIDTIYIANGLIDEGLVEEIDYKRNKKKQKVFKLYKNIVHYLQAEGFLDK